MPRYLPMLGRVCLDLVPCEGSGKNDEPLKRRLRSPKGTNRCLHVPSQNSDRGSFFWNCIDSPDGTRRREVPQ